MSIVSQLRALESAYSGSPAALARQVRDALDVADDACLEPALERLVTMSRLFADADSTFARDIALVLTLLQDYRRRIGKL